MNSAFMGSVVTISNLREVLKAKTEKKDIKEASSSLGELGNGLSDNTNNKSFEKLSLLFFLYRSRSIPGGAFIRQL